MAPEPFASDFPTRDIFVRLRQDLVQFLGVDRRAVRPGTRLVNLVEPHKRYVYWKYIDRGGPLTDAGCALATQRFEKPPGPRTSSGLLGGLKSWLQARRERPRFAFAFHAFTIRDTVIYLSCRLRRDSAQRWTREQISLKVRLLMAEAAGVPFEMVQPETPLPGLFG